MLFASAIRISSDEIKTFIGFLMVKSPFNLEKIHAHIIPNYPFLPYNHYWPRVAIITLERVVHRAFMKDKLLKMEDIVAFV